MPSRDEHGFSVMELLVALSIAAIISTLLFGGYSFASKAWARAQSAEDGSSEIYAAQTFLRRAFDGISLKPGENQLSGSSTSVQFATQLAMPGQQAMRTLITLNADTCPDHTCLMVELSHDDADAHSAQPIRAILLRDVESISFAYLSQTRGAFWQSNWSAADGAPMLVRIDVRLAKAARPWPTLYLAPAPVG